MVNEVKEIDLPDWFNGEVYKQGANVKNPYSGESCYLNAKELSMYDFIKGSEVLLSHHIKTNDLSKLFHEGLWWFKDNSPASYMILLD